MNQQTPKTVSTETQRQRVLESYRILDTLPEVAYDDIARLAGLICGAPIAMVSLIDQERQWFKAAIGLDVRETGRDVAFCDHAIRTPERLLEVADARLDPRFRNNPFVVGEPDIRFYAGMPILSDDGYALGTVCVIDSRPHSLSELQREALQSLSRLTTHLLEGRRTALQLKRQHAERDFVRQPAQGVANASGIYAVAVIEVAELAALRSTQGDAASVRIQHALQHALPDDMVCPHGETEYLVILSHGARAGTQLAAMRDSVGSEEGLSLTIGAAVARGGAEAMELVFERADKALRAARQREGAARLVVNGEVGAA